MMLRFSKCSKRFAATDGAMPLVDGARPHDEADSCGLAMRQDAKMKMKDVKDLLPMHACMHAGEQTRWQPVSLAKVSTSTALTTEGDDKLQPVCSWWFTF